MTNLIKVMFIALEGFWASPGHIARQVLLTTFDIPGTTFDIPGLLGRFTDEADFLRDELVPECMDIEIKPEHRTQLVPVFFETVVIVGIPPTRQKEWLSIIKRVETAALAVNSPALRIEVG